MGPARWTDQIPQMTLLAALVVAPYDWTTKIGIVPVTNTTHGCLVAMVTSRRATHQASFLHDPSKKPLYISVPQVAMVVTHGFD